MSNTIWKYPLPWPPISDIIDIDIPQGANVLHFETQNDKPYIWVLVDPHKPTKPRRFVLVGTGHPSPETGYIGTTAMMGGRLVVHLFEKEGNGEQ